MMRILRLAAMFSVGFFIGNYFNGLPLVDFSIIIVSGLFMYYMGYTRHKYYGVK